MLADGLAPHAARLREQHRQRPSGDQPLRRCGLDPGPNGTLLLYLGGRFGTFTDLLVLQ